MRKKPATGCCLFIQQSIAVNHGMIRVAQQRDEEAAVRPGFDLWDNFFQLTQRVGGDGYDACLRLLIFRQQFVQLN